MDTNISTYNWRNFSQTSSFYIYYLFSLFLCDYFNFLLSTHFIREINVGFLLWAKWSKKPEQMDTLMGIFTYPHNDFSYVLNQVCICIV